MLLHDRHYTPWHYSIITPKVLLFLFSFCYSHEYELQGG